MTRGPSISTPAAKAAFFAPAELLSELARMARAQALTEASDPDRCAACFKPLRAAPLGGRYVCEHPQNFRAALRGRYLSVHAPEPPHTHDACIVSKHGRPTLHLYGSAR